ncbi:MAG: hypothetical protein ACE5IP_11780 [Terriglobia bacterium]
MGTKGRKSAWLAAAVLAWLLAPQAGSAKTFTYRVKHQHAMGSCQGELIVTETQVRYQTDYRQDARIWTYSQIKRIERKGERKLTLYTYEDQSLQLGRDKPFDFTFQDGNVTDELFNFIATRLRENPEPQPPATPPGGRYEVAVKHRHVFGGCEGTLKITPNFIEYVTGREKDRRLWKYMDIKRIEHNSAYELDVYTYEDQALQFGRDKVFRFQLKEPLEPEVLAFIRQRLTP